MLVIWHSRESILQTRVQSLSTCGEGLKCLLSLKYVQMSESHFDLKMINGLEMLYNSASLHRVIRFYDLCSYIAIELPFSLLKFGRTTQEQSTLSSIGQK